MTRNIMQELNEMNILNKNRSLSTQSTRQVQEVPKGYSKFDASNIINLVKQRNPNYSITDSLFALILKELQDRRDEGKAIYNNGTLSTTSFTIIDTQLSPGHDIKGYTVENTGTTNLFVAHNIARQPELDVDIADVTKTAREPYTGANTPIPIFLQLAPGEIEQIEYNVKCIKSIHLLAVTGSPTFKIKLIW